jgi:hypothetical protein
MDGKMKQRVCIKFCSNLGKSVTKTLETLVEALGKNSLSRTAVLEWHSCFKAGRVSIYDDERSGLPSSSNTTENVEKIENSSMKTVAEHSMSSQTPLGSVVEFARRFKKKKFEHPPHCSFITPHTTENHRVCD